MKPFRLWIYRLMVGWLPETRFFALKSILLRWCGAEVGRNVRINSSAVVSGNGRLIIGDDVWVGARNLLCPVGSAEIVIEEHVDMGPEVMILTGSHKIDPKGAHIGGVGISSSVKIGKGSWLGARTTILPGVILAHKTLVAAGSVVVRSHDEACCLLAGAPAEFKKSLLDGEAVG